MRKGTNLDERSLRESNDTNASPKTQEEGCARKEMAEISHIYLFASKLTLGITYLLLAGILVFGDDFIRLWIGDEYAIKSHNVLLILTVYFLGRRSW